MSATGLPMRILYALVATPAACIGGFYLCIVSLTRAVPFLEHTPPIQAGWQDFVLSLLIAGALGFIVFLYALTLPWRRHRQRRGRVLRMVLSALLVLAVSMTGAAEAVPLRYVFGLMIWMSLALTITYIRYGLRDDPRSRRSASAAAAHRG